MLKLNSIYQFNPAQCRCFFNGNCSTLKMSLKFLQELEVEVELLKEDNEQLVTQYEREKVNKKDIRFCRVMDSTQLIRDFYLAKN